MDTLLKCILSLLVWICSINFLFAQQFKVLAGPIFGHTEDSLQHFWILLKPKEKQKRLDITEFNRAVYRFFEKKYAAELVDVTESQFIDKRSVLLKGQVKKAPEVLPDTTRFLFGSCNFPYPFLWLKGKKRWPIFDTMRTQKADFMLWLGDNTYYLLGDWKSRRRMQRKQLKVRTKEPILKFLEHMPQYAIWDDHDFGPNNSGSKFKGKETALEQFKLFWPNPAFGLDTVPGVFNSFEKGDAAFFMLDSRYYRDTSQLLGKGQMDWLCHGLKTSTANFKFIVSPIQFLVSSPNGEDWDDYGEEKKRLLEFIEAENITGVIFLSGDRHYAEAAKMERDSTYPIYDWTSSPLTSIPNPAYTRDNPYRIENSLLVDNNFGKVEIYGKGDKRTCRFSLIDAKGKTFFSKEVLLSNLK